MTSIKPRDPALAAALTLGVIALAGLAAWAWSRRERADDDEVLRPPVDVWRESLSGGGEGEEGA